MRTSRMVLPGSRRFHDTWWVHCCMPHVPLLQQPPAAGAFSVADAVDTAARPVWSERTPWVQLDSCVARANPNSAAYAASHLCSLQPAATNAVQEYACAHRAPTPNTPDTGSLAGSLYCWPAAPAADLLHPVPHSPANNNSSRFIRLQRVCAWPASVGMTAAAHRQHAHCCVIQES